MVEGTPGFLRLASRACPGSVSEDAINRARAHRLLDKHRAGEYLPFMALAQALVATGDAHSVSHVVEMLGRKD